jgi:hypothetical protein
MGIIPLISSLNLVASLNTSLHAYIGPGTGLSVIGAVLAVLAGIAIAIFGFFWYPIKRLLGKRKESQEPEPILEEED